MHDVGIIALANAIPDMGALTSLNLSSNNLKAEGAKLVAEAIKVTNCAIAVVGHHFHAHLHWLLFTAIYRIMGHWRILMPVATTLGS
jgi:hypothetical protein